MTIAESSKIMQTLDRRRVKAGFCMGKNGFEPEQKGKDDGMRGCGAFYHL